MILVDTSAWIDHLRVADRQLAELLRESAVCCHPFVIGELACGTIRNRGEILRLLRDLPQGPVVSHDEALEFVETNGLIGSGLGWVDVHLLASARLDGGLILTRDRRLAEAARRLGAAA